MIWVAYLALVFAVLWAVSEGSAITLPALSPIAQLVVRATTLLFGLLVAAAAVVLLVNLWGDPHHPLSDDVVPYLFFTSLGIDGLIYAAGTGLWWGPSAQLLRAVGWTMIVLPMTYPSTLTLALLLAAPCRDGCLAIPGATYAASTSSARVRACTRLTLLTPP